MGNVLMTGGLDAIVKESVRSMETDKAVQPVEGKTVEDCVSAIYKAFYEIAKKNRNGGSAVGLSGSDELIYSAVVHWYTTDKATVAELVDILSGGTDAQAMKDPAAPKPAAPKRGKKKAATEVEDVPEQVPAEDEDWDNDDDVPSNAPVNAPKAEAKPKPKAKPSPRPAPRPEPMTLGFEDDDFDID